MGLLGYNNNTGMRSGCRRPGCGCLIILILLLLAGGYFARKILGGYLPEITLPGGTVINQHQDGSDDSDNSFDYERDRDYGKTLKKGLDDDEIDGI